MSFSLKNWNTKCFRSKLGHREKKTLNNLSITEDREKAPSQPPLEDVVEYYMSGEEGEAK